MLLLASQACIERADSGPSGKSVVSNSDDLGWRHVGEFGGFAEVSVNSDDPMEVRFDDGKFKLLSGINATSDELWACDLDISRIQVFDFDGNHKRNIGLGCPIEGNLPSLSELFRESREKHITDKDHWEDLSGNTWRSQKLELFRASDVVVVDGGYYFADWVKTSFRKEPLRDFAVYYVPGTGGISPVELNELTFPTYLTVDNTELAVTDPTATSMWAGYYDGGNWKSKFLVQGAGTHFYFPLEEYYSDDDDYLAMLFRLSHSGTGVGEYFNMGGADIAFDKLVVCDTGNRRLQIVSMVHEIDWTFGENVRQIWGDPKQGDFRFYSALDISIAADGTIYVLDPGELEIAVLDSTFNRIGAFGKGDFSEPYALDLSDDGKHCFVSDRRDNMIHHYATTY